MMLNGDRAEHLLRAGDNTETLLPSQPWGNPKRDQQIWCPLLPDLETVSEAGRFWWAEGQVSPLAGEMMK